MTVPLNIGLALLLAGIAFWTIIVRDTFAAVAGYITLGLLLTLAWLALAAVDVALTEAAIGAGLTGALLIGAAFRLRTTEAAMQAREPSGIVRAIAAAASAAVSAAIVACILSLPDPAPSLAPDVAQHLASTGVANPITAVLLSFRSMDTLLEAIVLLIGLIGVWSLAPDRFWGGRPGSAQLADPNNVLAYLARVLPPIGLVIGIYIFWTGADNPGGKFQGATVLAASWFLVIVAGLGDLPAVNRYWVRILLAAGPAVFIGVGALGSVIAGYFLAYPEDLAKPLIIVIEAALLPSLALTLTLLLSGPPSRPERSP